MIRIGGDARPRTPGQHTGRGVVPGEKIGRERAGIDVRIRPAGWLVGPSDGGTGPLSLREERPLRRWRDSAAPPRPYPRSFRLHALAAAFAAGFVSPAPGPITREISSRVSSTP